MLVLEDHWKFLLPIGFPPLVRRFLWVFLLLPELDKEATVASTSSITESRLGLGDGALALSLTMLVSMGSASETAKSCVWKKECKAWVMMMVMIELMYVLMLGSEK